MSGGLASEDQRLGAVARPQAQRLHRRGANRREGCSTCGQKCLAVCPDNLTVVDTRVNGAITLGALLTSARLMFHGGDGVQVLTADALMEECQAISARWRAGRRKRSTNKAAARALVLELQELATADRAWTGAWWGFNVEIDAASLNGIFANGKLAQFGGRFLYDSDPYCKDFGNQSCMVTAQTGRSWF